MFVEVRLTAEIRRQSTPTRSPRGTAVSFWGQPEPDETAERQQRSASSPRDAHDRKAEDLLFGPTRALVVGAPGSGKTTLLKYLTLSTVQAGQRFPVFLECKNISEQALATANGDLIELVFRLGVAAHLGHHATPIETVKRHFLAQLEAGQVALFLDALDEVGSAGLGRSLHRALVAFLESPYGQRNSLVVSARRDAVGVRFDDLAKLELRPLASREIRTFLARNFPTDPSADQLWRDAERRPALRELLGVPLFLGAIEHLERICGGRPRRHWASSAVRTGTIRRASCASAPRRRLAS